MLLLLMVSGCKSQRGSTPGVPQPDDAARDAVATLSRLVTSENFRALGFESVDEAKGATLQAPAADPQHPPSTRSRPAKPGASVEQLLAEPVETLYPVAVGGNVRTGVTISKRSDGFAPSAFGGYDLARRLSRYRQGGDGPGEFVVRIPAMNFSFLGRMSGGLNWFRWSPIRRWVEEVSASRCARVWPAGSAGGTVRRRADLTEPRAADRRAAAGLAGGSQRIHRPARSGRANHDGHPAERAARDEGRQRRVQPSAGDPSTVVNSAMVTLGSGRLTLTVTGTRSSGGFTYTLVLTIGPSEIPFLWKDELAAATGT